MTKPEVPLEENAERERHDNAFREVAVLVLKRADGTMLMMRTQRLPGSWQHIGGGVQAQDHTPRETLSREAKEELGLTLDPAQMEFLGDLPYDFGHGIIHCYTATTDESDPELDPDSDEVAEVKWVGVATALSLPTFPATRRLLEIMDEDSA